MRVYFGQHRLQLFPSLGKVDRLPPGVMGGDVLLNPGTESLLSPHVVGDTNEFQLGRMASLSQGHCSPAHTTRHSALQVQYVCMYTMHSHLYLHTCVYVHMYVVDISLLGLAHGKCTYCRRLPDQGRRRRGLSIMYPGK